MSEVEVAFFDANDNTQLHAAKFNEVEFQALLKARQFKIGEKKYQPRDHFYNIDMNVFIINVTKL